MKEEKLEAMCVKLAEVNATIATSGVAATTFIDGNPTNFSLAMFGICGAMLSYNAYNMYQSERSTGNKQIVKKYNEIKK